MSIQAVCPRPVKKKGKLLATERRSMRESARVATRDQPLFPTDHLPGTPGKMAVIVSRIRAGENSYHPEDAKPNEE